jgi:phosphoserine phosphatase
MFLWRKKSGGHLISFSDLVAKGVLFLRRLRLQKRLRILRRRAVVGAPVGPTACASVIIPVLDEAKTIADVVAYALKDPATAEVIVIDDGSIDDTVQLAKQAGAKVFTSSMLGKGASMGDGVALAQNEIIVFLDGDLQRLRPKIISDLCEPLIHDDVDLVKAQFGRSSGRVTELTAKPMIKIFFPELAGIAQPLGGIIAARKTLLNQLSFENDYGVDIGILLDAFSAGANIVQVDIGALEHESQSLPDLAIMAMEVSRVIFDRAKKVGRLHVEQVASMLETQCQAASTLPYILSRRKGQQKILLLDMDGTVSPSRFVVELARACGKEEELMAFLGENELDSQLSHDYAKSVERTGKISQIFRFVHKSVFEKAARSMEIREGVLDFVKDMRRQGFMVGIISDSYFVAAEIIRRRIFADFALAHSLMFDNGVCTGLLQINPAFVADVGAASRVSKKHVLQAFRDEIRDDNPITETWAIGDNVNDIELLKSVDRAFVINPKSPALAEAGFRCVSSFLDLKEEVPRPEPAVGREDQSSSCASPDGSPDSSFEA